MSSGHMEPQRPAPQAEIKADEHKCTPGNEHNRRPNWAAVIELLLAAVIATATVVSACVASRQASIMDTQAAISQRQTKLAEAGQRPWIDVVGIDPQQPPFDGINTFQLTHNLKNVGHSPAYIVVKSKAAPGEPWQHIQEEPCNESISQKEWDWGWLILPNGQFPYNDRAILSQQDISNIKTSSGQYKLAISGCVYYRIPGENIVHKTHFIAAMSIEDPSAPLKEREQYGPFEGGTVEIPKGRVLRYKNVLMAGDSN